MTLKSKLGAGISQLEVEVDAETQQRLLEYIALLEKWNRVHNLTAVRDPEEMVTLHLLDSLSILAHVNALVPSTDNGGRLLDVGSGAGLPGVVLALVRPDLNVTTMDSSHKKAGFMRQAKAVLGLANLEVVCGRVEAYKPERKFDVIVSRAFSEISEFIRLTRHLLADGGVWLAMKGVYPYDELTQTKNVTSEVVELHVPGLAARRHLVILKAAK
jgi:16S rRNA (guanine527-N7)-methyltransferase